MSNIKGIQSQGVQHTELQKVNQQPAQEKQVRETGKQQAEKSALTISNQAVQFKNAKTELNKIPDIRQDKVNNIQSQIQSGNYNVPGEKVAESMLKSMGM
jgi:negative regulator of flagellin synthesis FlgM